MASNSSSTASDIPRQDGEVEVDPVKAAAFMDRIGKTQGIRFKITPPKNANKIAKGRLMVLAEGAVGAPKPAAAAARGPVLAVTSNA